MLPINTIINGDCLIEIQKIDNQSIDCIICDLPYGTTNAKFDSLIPLEILWIEYKRIIKKNHPIVLFAAQPFTSILLNSNIKQYKYNWVWKKNIPTGFLNAKHQPLRNLEDILIFAEGKTKYNPQMKIGNIHTRGSKSKNTGGEIYNDFSNRKETKSNEYYPNQLLEFNKDNKSLHPTQKPILLLEYLIKTYSNENDLILDNCAGSFTTSIASENLNRNWICIERENKYCDIGAKRIEDNRVRLKGLRKENQENISN